MNEQQDNPAAEPSPRLGVEIGGKFFDIVKHEDANGKPVWSSPQQPRVYVRGLAATQNCETDDLLLSLEVSFHRWVLAEFNTHRVLSRNSASSRAIPTKQRIAYVRERPALPIVWAAEQKGMQGGEELNQQQRQDAREAWENAAHHAAQAASQLRNIGVHKSITNRLLEPFLMHTAVVTATEWLGFIDQRDSRLAQPEIHLPAALISCALSYYTYYDNSAKGEPGTWHLPYVSVAHDGARLLGNHDISSALRTSKVRMLDALSRLSVARCARVSYKPFDGIDVDVEKDLALYDRLRTARPMHASPFEHVAVALRQDQRGQWPGNLQGFAQLRHFVEMGINPFGGTADWSG